MAVIPAAAARVSGTSADARFGTATPRLAPPPASPGGMRANVRRTAAVAALCATLASAAPSPALAASREGPVPSAPAVARSVDVAAPTAGASRLPPVADMVAGAVAQVRPARRGGPGGRPDMILSSAAADYCAAGSAGRRHQAALGAHELKMREYVRDHNARVRSARASVVRGAVMVGAAAVLAGVAGKAMGHRYGASRGGSGRNFTPIAMAAAIGPGLYKMAKAGDFGRAGVRPARIIERADRPRMEAPECEPEAARGAAGGQGAAPDRQAAVPQSRAGKGNPSRSEAVSVQQSAGGAASEGRRAERPGLGERAAGALGRGWTALRSAVTPRQADMSPAPTPAQRDRAGAQMAARMLAQGSKLETPSGRTRLSDTPAPGAAQRGAGTPMARQAAPGAAPVRPVITTPRAGGRSPIAARDHRAAPRTVPGKVPGGHAPASR